MIFSVMGISSVSVSAATTESAIPIKIVNVKRQYANAQTFLDLCNSYRTARGLNAWTLDSTLLEQSMKRAAELSILASVNSPDGTIYSSSIDKGQLIGYDVSNTNALLKSFQDDTTSYKVLISSSLNAVGVGYVTVNGKTYIAILLANKTPSSVSSSVMAQKEVTVEQETNVLPSYLSKVSAQYASGQQVICGTTVIPYLVITNSAYPSVTAYITSDNLEVTSSNSSYFKVTDGTIKAVSPGRSTISIWLSDAPTVKTSLVLQAVGYSLDSCTVADIEDQYYTGEYLRPGVSITGKSGNLLILGTDYKVSYANNKEIGTATITITGLNSYAGSTIKKTFNIVESPYGSFKVTQSASLTTLCTGETTTLTASITGTTGKVTYTFDYAKYDTALWKDIQSSTSNTCSFSINAVGKYNVRVKAVDSAGKVSTAVTVISVNQQLTASVSGSSTITLGEAINVKTTTNGGVAPLTYSCYVKKTSDKSWTTVSSYSTNGSFSYIPKAATTYELYVNVKSFTGYETKASLYFTVKNKEVNNTSTVSATTINLGESVTLKGAASGGTGSFQYTYCYKLKSATTWTAIKGYSTTTSVAFKPKAAGTYDLCVKIKDSAGTVAKKTFDLTVKSVPTLVNKSTISTDTIALGSSITIKGAATGGLGSYQYTYCYAHPSMTGWKSIKGYSATTSVTFKPTMTGSYTICIKVKDSLDNVTKVYYLLTVKPKLENTSAISAASIEVGQKVTLTGGATGGMGSYQYTYCYKLTSATTWKVIKGYSTTTSVSLKPPAIGTYDVCVKVKDKSGNVAKKTFTLKVTESTALVNNSSLSASSIKLGSTVTLKGAAAKGAGSYQYTYCYSQDAGNTWKVLKGYSTATTYSFKPSAAGSYQICIKVKDKDGTVAKKYLDLTVTK